MRTPRTPSEWRRSSSASGACSSVDVDDAAAILRPDFAHRLQHAAVVAPVCRGLHEYEALDPEFSREHEKILDGRYRGRIAQVGLVIRIESGRAEDVEMAVAAGGWRFEFGAAFDVR